jgi:hypothetical protein
MYWGRREAAERISINFAKELNKGYVLGWKEGFREDLHQI